MKLRRARSAPALVVFLALGCHSAPAPAPAVARDAQPPATTAPVASADAPPPAAPRLACDDAPLDPHGLVRGKASFAKKRTRYAVAGTKLEVCVEDWIVAKGEDGHMLIPSVAVYEAGVRIDPTTDDAGEPTYRGLYVGASLLVPGVTEPGDGLFLHLR